MLLYLSISTGDSPAHLTGIFMAMMVASLFILGRITFVELIIKIDIKSIYMSCLIQKQKSSK